MFLIYVLLVCALAFIAMLIAVYAVAVIYEAIKECFELVIKIFFKKKIRFDSDSS